MDRLVRYRPGLRLYSIIDGAFAAMLILPGVVDEGLGCFIVGAFDDEQVSPILGLPERGRPIGILPIGYLAEPAKKYRRIPLEHIIHYDRWQGATAGIRRENACGARAPRIPGIPHGLIGQAVLYGDALN